MISRVLSKGFENPRLKKKKRWEIGDMQTELREIFHTVVVPGLDDHTNVYS